MKKLDNIKNFYIKTAYYEVGDGNGGGLLLKVSYKNNSFEVISRSGNLLRGGVYKEAQLVARDLLKRKAGVDFAKKHQVTK